MAHDGKLLAELEFNLKLEQCKDCINELLSYLLGMIEYTNLIFFVLAHIFFYVFLSVSANA